MASAGPIVCSLARRPSSLGDGSRLPAPWRLEAVQQAGQVANCSTRRAMTAIGPGLSRRGDAPRSRGSDRIHTHAPTALSRRALDGGPACARGRRRAADKLPRYTQIEATNYRGQQPRRSWHDAAAPRRFCLVARAELSPVQHRGAASPLAGSGHGARRVAVPQRFDREPGLGDLDGRASPVPVSSTCSTRPQHGSRR